MLMDNNFAQNKIMLEQNLFKIENIKKEDSIRKSQSLCQNLQIKFK